VSGKDCETFDWPQSTCSHYFQRYLGLREVPLYFYLG
jgi:hypothetical protein